MKHPDLFNFLPRARACVRTRALFCAMLVLLFSTTSKSVWAQSTVNNVVNLNGQKIEWRFHKYYMTRAQMQAIVDKPANERVILIPLMVKLPEAFKSTSPQLGATGFDYEVRDPKTGLGSIDIVHHIPSSGGEGGTRFSALAKGKGTVIMTGNLSVVPGIEKFYGGTFSSQRSSESELSSIIPINTYDTIFWVPFYVNKAGSFDVCLKAQSNTACQTVDPSWNKCPGQYAIYANFFDQATGNFLINSATTRQDFFQDNFGLFDPNSQFNSYNICGGVQILESPTAVFDALDSACPQSPFAFNAFAFASQNLNDFKILAALNNDNFNISINTNIGSYTATS